MPEQDSSITVALIPLQKQALYQSKTLRRAGALALFSYLFSLFMLASAAIHSNTKIIADPLPDQQTHSDPLASMANRQQYAWGHDAPFDWQETAQHWPFEQSEAVLSASFTDLISSRCLSAAVRCMARGFAQMFMGFKQLFFHLGSFMP